MAAVTAAITTFNRRHFLDGAIRSVLSQTWQDLELLVLDNSSADGTENLVRRFVDRRIRYLRHPPLGLGASRNLALSEASGEFIAFLDDDDEWLPEKLESQLGVFATAPSSVGLVYGGVTFIDCEGRELVTVRPTLRGRVFHDLLWHNDLFTASASNPMIRRATLDALGGYDNSLEASEDWELYVRLAQAYEVELTPRAIVKVRRHAGQRSRDDAKARLRAEQVVFDRFHSVMESALRSLFLQTIGGKLCRMGLPRAGRRMLLSAIATDPRNYKAYAQLLLSLGGMAFYNRLHRLYVRTDQRRRGIPSEC